MRVLPHEPKLSAEPLAGSDEMELRVPATTPTSQALLRARLAHLRKGASGAALQIISLLLGLNYT